MLAALSNRRFCAYLIAAALADGGWWVATIAQSWLVLKLTASPLWLGVVAGCSQLPFLLFSLVGGDLADRFDRRAVVAINNVAIACVALLTAALVASNAVNVWWLVGLGFASGTLSALEHPVDRAWLYDLVEGREVGSAIALSSLEWSIARTAGPALGGIAIATLGIAAGFAAYGFSALPLAALALVLRARSHATGDAPSPEPRTDGDLRAIAIFSLFIASFTIGVAPYIALLPDIARTRFDADARMYGLLSAAGGVGAMLGALGLSLRGEVPRLGRVVPLTALVGAALLFAFTRATALGWAVALLFAMGAVDTLMYALANTYVQRCADAARRGRANAIFSLAFLGGLPIGSFALGALAARFGSLPTLAVAALGVCGATAAFWFGSPAAREAA